MEKYVRRQKNCVGSADGSFQCYILTHSFPMHPFSTPKKHQKIIRFSDVFGEQRKGALETNGLAYIRHDKQKQP